MTEFETFFQVATGHRPHGYQARIARDGLPDVVEAPTGTGKTGVILAWLWRRLRAEHAAATPRRLVYALPQRSLVDQVAGEARQWLAEPRAGRPGCAARGDGRPGQTQGEWREDMHKPAIVVGTVDSLVSKALNRGYGIGRAIYPIDFALVTNGAHWVIDEIQLCPESDDDAAAACRVRGAVRHGGAVRADLHVGDRARRAAGDRGQPGGADHGRDPSGGTGRGTRRPAGRRADGPAAGR